MRYSKRRLFSTTFLYLVAALQEVRSDVVGERMFVSDATSKMVLTQATLLLRGMSEVPFGSAP